MWRKRNPSALLVAMQTGEATVENSMEFPQKTKNGTAFDLAIPLLGLYPKNPESSSLQITNQLVDGVIEFSYSCTDFLPALSGPGGLLIYFSLKLYQF